MTIRTAFEFREARRRLGLSIEELGSILNTKPDTIRRRWESRYPDSDRSPNPVACRVLEWMESEGWPFWADGSWHWED